MNDGVDVEKGMGVMTAINNENDLYHLFIHV
jgi:hypothetical protein